MSSMCDTKLSRAAVAPALVTHLRVPSSGTFALFTRGLDFGLQIAFFGCGVSDLFKISSSFVTTLAIEGRSLASNLVQCLKRFLNEPVTEIRVSKAFSIGLCIGDGRDALSSLPLPLSLSLSLSLSLYLSI